MSDERALKHGRILEYLTDHDLDAVLLSRRCNFSWYTCGAHNYVSCACDVGNSHLLVRRDGACVLSNNIEAARLAQEELAGSGIDVLDAPYFDTAAQSELVRRAIGTMRVAADVPPAGVVVPQLPADFDRLRWTLTESEIARYRAVCGDTVGAVESVAKKAEPGQTESDLAGMLSDALLRRGCQPWVLLVGGDERVAKFRHPLPAGKPVRKFFMLVACAERGGLIAACTRLACFGAVQGEFADRQQAVATVDAALMSTTQPGVALGDVFAEAQAAYASVGFPQEWRLHHQGGSIGYLPRELKAAPGEQTPARANQAFAWNPSIRGAKSEDTILCRSAGPELLAEPTDWPAIDAEWKGQVFRRPAIREL